MYGFQIKHKSDKSKARVGVLSTFHGKINTPVFMPVGTVGAVKTMTAEDLKKLGAQIILANAYHLYLRPGDELIAKAGGLHKFSGWEGAFLTDSGGYQVFSLGEGLSDTVKAKKSEISDEGVVFYSHLDGSKHIMTAEKSIEIQRNLGADVIMAFDDCPPANADRKRAEKAVQRSIDWWKRCKSVALNDNQILVPICQGSVYRDLREQHCRYLNQTNSKILAIGGVSVGELKKDIYKVADWCTDVLDPKRPRYLMGMGYPEDIVEIVSLGIDMFDCVLPTRLARHGVIWRWSKKKNLKKIDCGYEQVDISKSKFKDDFSLIDENCNCKACSGGYKLLYIRHLIKEKEPLGIHLLTCHNLKFVFELVELIRKKIADKNF